MPKRNEKPGWIVTGSVAAIAGDVGLEALGFGMTLLACMWRDQLRAIPSDPEVILELVKGQFPPGEKVDAAWIKKRWPRISKLFHELPDGTFEPNPLMFSPPDSEPPSSEMH